MRPLTAPLTWRGVFPGLVPRRGYCRATIKVILDQGEVPAQLDHGRQLATFVERPADCLGGPLVNGKTSTASGKGAVRVGSAAQELPRRPAVKPARDDQEK